MAEIISFEAYRRLRKLRKIKSARKRQMRLRVRQGDLDGLCGVYAIINAVSLVCGLNQKKQHQLFKSLLRTLEKNHYAAKAVLTGTGRKHLRRMLREAMHYMADAQDTAIKVSPLFPDKAHVNVADYWQGIRAFLSASDETRAVIVGISGRIEHWTCVRSVTRHSLCLSDSNATRYIRKRSCRTGKPKQTHYYLIPSEAWGISLKH